MSFKTSLEALRAVGFDVPDTVRSTDPGGPITVMRDAENVHRDVWSVPPSEFRRIVDTLGCSVRVMPSARAFDCAADIAVVMLAGYRIDPECLGGFDLWKRVFDKARHLEQQLSRVARMMTATLDWLP